MNITGVELRRIEMPLVAPFRTSFGVVHSRDILLVRVVTPDAEGWGECVTEASPLYSAEYTDGAAEMLRRFLIPALAQLSTPDSNAVGPALAPFRGHPMAKAALETALLDAELRAAGVPLSRHLGAVRDRVDCGVSVGIMNSIRELLDTVAGYVEAGYRRIKLKIQPGWDVEPVSAIRDRFGGIVLQVDANAAYTLADARHLARLDEFDLLLIEQPLADDDIHQHATLAAQLRTPVCLDESIKSAADAAHAIAIGACSIVNIKPGRVGGYLEARRIHDVCQAHGIAVWCGGMLESGVGRAANLALAALPGFTLPGDTSASSRYFHADVTDPFELDDGQLTVPTGPGIGVSPLPDRLAELTTHTEWLSL